MAKFKLLGGLHSEGGKLWKRGDVLESDKDLFKLFPQKFARAANNAKASKGRDPLTMQEDLEDIRGMLEEEALEEGELVDSDEAVDGDDSDADDVTSTLGEDVTHKFPEAREQDLAVVFDKKAKKYSVVDPDAPDVAVNKEEELKTQPKVKEFLKTFAEG